MQGNRIETKEVILEEVKEKRTKRKCIKSSYDARRTFIDENDSKFKKRSKSAKWK